MEGVGTVPGAERKARRARRGRLVLLAVAALLAALWVGRRPALVAVGRALVAEDALGPADLLVASNAATRADALEAARLYDQKISPRIAIAEWYVDPATAEIHCLGVPLLDQTELARTILERSGVPAAAIQVMPGAAQGTEDEVAATAAYVRADASVRSVLFLAPRTHTARVRWLLRRRVPSGVRIAVRSAPYDTFSPDDWWHSRDMSREVMSELLRWLNTGLLGDAWSGSRISQEPARCSCCPEPPRPSPAAL